MTIEKADRPRRIVHVIWSPSRNSDKQTRVKRELEVLPLSEEIRFEFYRNAETEKGGYYAEA